MDDDPTEPVVPQPTADPAPVADAVPRRSPLVIAVAVLAAVALVAAVFAFVGWRDARDDADDRAREIDTLEARVEELEREPAERGSDDGGGLLDDLGAPGLDDLQDLAGSLEDLDVGDLDLGEFAGSLECLTQSGVIDLLGGIGNADIPDDDPRAQYDAIARWIAEERELEFDAVPEPTFVSTDEMARRVENNIRDEYPEDVARADDDLLTALGVIDRDDELIDIYSEFVGGQVAGYYDPDTGELVVLGDDEEPFDAFEQTIIAHELQHALADQALDLPEATFQTDDPDAALASAALIEGDATLTMTQFQLGALDLDEMLGMLDQLGSGELRAQQDALEDAPPYLARQLMFPYTEGLEFVCALHDDGGWASVDAAYREPPTNTAQILFPQRYRDRVAAVDAPDPQAPSGGGWREVRRTTFGAADLMFLLESADVDDARDVASAWAGGEVVQWRAGDAVSVGISLVSNDGDALCAPVREWAETLDNAAVACANELVSVATSTSA